jgi:hypothetical protein
MRGVSNRLTYANVMASIAVFVSLGGGAYAAMSMPPNSVGTATIRNGAVTGRKLANASVTASKIAPGTITGAQIDAARLGTVPAAQHAVDADSAVAAQSAESAITAQSAENAATAGTATNATLLGGLAPSAFQSRVTGTCGVGDAISQVNADGSVGCTNVASNVQGYSGRITTGLLSATAANNPIFLTIPGVAHLEVGECTATTAVAVLFNDGNVDGWFQNGNGFGSLGPNWWDSGTSENPSVSTGSAWVLGVGTGPGAEVIQVTAAMTDYDGTCTFQGSALVITASS